MWTLGPGGLHGLIQRRRKRSTRRCLTNDLLPFFKGHHLSKITVAEIDRSRQQKVREAAEITAAAENGKPMMVSYVDRRGRWYHRRARPLSARSIDMQIDLLAQILAVAVDHGHLPSNPALGKRRRMMVSKPRPVHVDSAEQIAVLLEAAGQLDRREAVIDVSDRRGRSWTQRPAVQTTGRRAAIAALLLGGGRASATGAMVWRDVELANGRFEVGRDKSAACNPCRLGSPRTSYGTRSPRSWSRSARTRPT